MAAPLLKNVPLSARMLPMRELANVITRSKTTKSPLVSYLKAADASVLEKPQEPLKTFKERVAEMREKFSGVHDPVNIGYPLKKTIVNRREKRNRLKTLATSEMEKKARLREVSVDVHEVQQDYNQEKGYHNVYELASHYGVYKDLFGDAYFYPQTQLQVAYDIDEEDVNPVCCGNILEPSEVAQLPTVQYEFKPDNLYTLCMSCPDSHLQDNNKEYLHWLVGNIPGDSIKDGELLCNYLQPFPIKGTGFLRYVFLLYEQNKKLDFKEEMRPANCTSLRQRTFKTYDFYRKYQDDITPVGLAFFQSQWDQSVTSIFWDILDMKEPGFKFIPQKDAIPKQKIWPHRQPFNIYLDKYRDIKDLNEEVLKEKLKRADPFKPRDPGPKYPNTFKLDNERVPTWRKMKIEEQRMKKKHWKDLDD